MVAIDTMVVIFGIRAAQKGSAKPVDQKLKDLRRRALVLLETLAASGETVVLPSIAAAEVLAGIPTKDHGSFLAELQDRFLIPPFNVRASQVAAQLWQQHRGLPKSEQIARSTLKADTMIVATARVVGATALYSHEPKVRRLAELAGMAGRDLPTHSEDLFIDLEARRASNEEE